MKIIFSIFVVILFLIGCGDEVVEDEINSEEHIEESGQTIPVGYLNFTPIFNGHYKQLTGLVPEEGMFSGNLVAVDTSTQEEKSFYWHVQYNVLDNTIMNRTIAKLPVGNYDLYIILQNASFQYIGFKKNVSISPDKKLRSTLWPDINFYPYIGTPINNPLDIKRLIKFDLSYIPTEFISDLDLRKLWVGIKREDQPEIFIKSELKIYFNRFYELAEFYIEKLPFIQKYTVKAYFISAGSIIQFGRIDKEVSAGQDYIVRTWLKPLKLLVNYARIDYRKWEWTTEGSGIPLYLHLPYARVRLIYKFPLDITEKVTSGKDIHIKGKLYYGGYIKTTVYNHTKKINYPKMTYHIEHRLSPHALAGHLSLSLINNRTHKKIGACFVRIPKHKCVNNYEIPHACLVKKVVSLQLSCLFTIKQYDI